MKPLYTAVATAHGGREGQVRSSDGVVELPLKMPKELGGPGGQATNPEQLFAAGYAACFESALRLVARMQQKQLKDAHITAHVTIGQTEDKGFGLAVELQGKIEGLGQPEAQALMEAAHQVCPYSKATRGNIQVKLTAL
ncbi:MAG TPA: organic hydroperoxide resistance protein [Myxococcaceae bacterium]|nr:organic hydroperoxide resistance protein [Myxococcaceae bacterium]